MVLLFSRYQFYPNEGFEDFRGEFGSIEDAKTKHSDSGDEFQWAQIVNSETYETIEKWWIGEWESNVSKQRLGAERPIS